MTLTLGLIKIAKTILAVGPHRVVIDSSGEATTSKRAREEHDITPDIVFIRKDGWSLGAPKRFAEVAEKMWEDMWVGVIMRPQTEPITYGEYLRVKTIIGGGK